VMVVVVVSYGDGGDNYLSRKQSRELRAQDLVPPLRNPGTFEKYLDKICSGWRLIATFDGLCKQNLIQGKEGKGKEYDTKSHPKNDIHPLNHLKKCFMRARAPACGSMPIHF
jgi:hypothetical protein